MIGVGHQQVEARVKVEARRDLARLVDGSDIMDDPELGKVAFLVLFRCLGLKGEGANRMSFL